MIDYFNEYLPNYNQTIEGMPELINKHDELVKMLDEYDKELNDINKTIDTGRTIANITTPIVAYEELDNNKQK